MERTAFQLHHRNPGDEFGEISNETVNSDLADLHVDSDNIIRDRYSPTTYKDVKYSNSNHPYTILRKLEETSYSRLTISRNIEELPPVFHFWFKILLD